MLSNKDYDVTMKYSMREKNFLLVIGCLVVLELVLQMACSEGGDSLTISALKLDKTEYLPGELITVVIASPVRLQEDAWIGIIPSSVPHGDEMRNDINALSCQYLFGKRRATLTFTAPRYSGMYDIRLNNSDFKGREVASVSFTVVGSSENPYLSMYRTARQESFRYGIKL